MPFLTILFAGGGSLGHLLPSLAVLSELRRLRSDIRPVFVCADRDEETECLKKAGVSFHALRAPKSPRTLSFSTLLFPFTFIHSCIIARAILRKEKPDLVFSKGGFVSVPLCLAARMLSIPVVLHESDSVPSISTRVLSGFAKKICTGFELQTRSEKFEVTGNPVRSELFSGNEAAAQRITGFSGRRPVVMIIGGSQGSKAINDAVSASLPKLLDLADIIHLTGKGKMNAASHARYFVRPSVSDDLPHLYALSDLVITRAGSGVLSELSMLSKPAIVIPLTGVAHDHQLRNAEALERKNAIVLLHQENISTLPAIVRALLQNDVRRKEIGAALHATFPRDAAKTIASIILAEAMSARIQS